MGNYSYFIIFNGLIIRMFMFFHQGNGVNKNKSQNGRPGGNRPGEKQPKVFHMSIQENVSLHKTENAWKPTVKADKTAENGGSEADALTELSKKARGILNKLTPQRFDTLVDQFDKLEIDTEEKLKLCMELVFEKVRGEKQDQSW